MAHGIDLKRADAQHRNFRLPLHPVPQRCTHPRQQLADIERLVDVVIGAEVKRLDLFYFALARRQDDDRQIRPFARAPDDVLSIAIGQAEIEQDNVGRLGRNALDAVGNRARAGHLVIVCFQRRLEKAQDCRLVIDDQNAKPGAHDVEHLQLRIECDEHCRDNGEIFRHVVGD